MRGPRLVRVARRGPVLRPSPRAEGVYGLDLTAGCPHGCPFCHIRGSARYPGPDRVLFDPTTAEALDAALDDLGDSVRTVVLSPEGDPLPPLREVRAEAVRCVDLLLGRGVGVVVMTRGRVPRRLVEVLSAHPDRARVALAFATLDKGLARTLEPRAGSPRGRLRDLGRLTRAGVPVEVRLEPLVPGLTDTREAVRPLFAALAEAGARRVVAHYLFLHPSMTTPWEAALEPLGLVERLRDAFAGGPVFAVGSLGPTKALPLDVRREGLARIVAWGAEAGLTVETGAAQNPDLPRLQGPAPPAGRKPKASRRKAPAKAEAVSA